MKKPDLRGLSKWIDEDCIESVLKKRKASGEQRRDRKLATIETIMCCIAVALYSEKKSLHEILKITTTCLEISWSISVSAFSKARKRFSPQAFLPYFRNTCG